MAGDRRPRCEVCVTLSNLRNTVSQEKFAFARKLRSRPTRAERLLWEAIRKDVLGYRFRRQHVIRGYIVDFWCPSAAVAVEVDGGYHETPEQRARDANRDKAMRGLGIRVLRVSNAQVEHELDHVLLRLRALLEAG
ncbi:MAG TPA: endonuclease domain-containing protein [Polyangiaceae bacterium]